MRKQIAMTVAATALAFAIASPQASSDTYCTATAEAGTWVNRAAGISDLSRIEVETTCPSGLPGWKVRALSRCARTECSWGIAAGVRRPDGALAALFDTFSAERLVRLSVDRDTMQAAVISVPRDGGAPRTVDQYVLERRYD